MTERTIEIVQGELDRAEELVRVLAKELHELKAAKAGIAIGDVVLVKVRGQEVEAKVTQINTRWQDKPWIKGVLRKKDGGWGARERHLYSDWKLA